MASSKNFQGFQYECSITSTLHFKKKSFPNSSCFDLTVIVVPGEELALSASGSAAVGSGMHWEIGKRLRLAWRNCGMFDMSGAQGSLNETHIWGDRTMRMYGDFEGFSLR